MTTWPTEIEKEFAMVRKTIRHAIQKLLFADATLSTLSDSPDESEQFLEARVDELFQELTAALTALHTLYLSYNWEDALAVCGGSAQEARVLLENLRRLSGLKADDASIPTTHPTTH